MRLCRGLREWREASAYSLQVRGHGEISPSVRRGAARCRALRSPPPPPGPLWPSSSGRKHSSWSEGAFTDPRRLPGMSPVSVLQKGCDGCVVRRNVASVEDRSWEPHLPPLPLCLVEGGAGVRTEGQCRRESRASAIPVWGSQTVLRRDSGRPASVHELPPPGHP